MGAQRIALIQGHPDSRGNRYAHALCAAYADGAVQAGRQVRVIDVAKLDFPVLRTQDDWENGEPAASIKDAQETIEWCDHMVIFYPLWLGSMPALLKAFFEQVMRPGFAISSNGEGKQWRRLLRGRSARIVITMGMPAFVYRWYFGAHSLKSLERNILALCGIGPIRESLIGLVGAKEPFRRTLWRGKILELGREGR